MRPLYGDLATLQPKGNYGTQTPELRAAVKIAACASPPHYRSKYGEACPAVLALAADELRRVKLNCAHFSKAHTQGLERTTLSNQLLATAPNPGASATAFTSDRLHA